MPLSRGAVADIPLTTLFPYLSAIEGESLKQAARAVDAVRADGAAGGWEWMTGLAVSPGPQPWTSLVFGADVVAQTGEGDGLEYLLYVVWTGSGKLAIDAAVNVACWCDTDHATHDAESLRMVIDDETSLHHAFEVGAERLVRWLADPRAAGYWRARASLPPRWTS